MFSMSYTTVLSIGSAYIDINCFGYQLDEKGMQPETESVGSAYEIQAGGSAINFARVICSLGMTATFIGKVGDDAMGHQLHEKLVQSRINPALIVGHKAQTNLGLNFINQGGETIMAVVGDANQSFTASELMAAADDYISQSRYLLLGGCFKLPKLLSAFTDLVLIAKKHGVKVALDHGRIFSGVTEEEIITVKKLACLVDYYLPSRFELQELWGIKSIRAGLSTLSKQVSGTVIVKDSHNGAQIYNGHTPIEVPAFPVEVRNPVGAGDSFNAGFIAAQSQDKPLLESIRYACATAAVKIANPELPTSQSVDQLLSRYPTG